MYRDNVKVFIFFVVTIIGLSLIPVISIAQTTGDKSYITKNGAKGYFPLFAKRKVTPIYVADADYPGVMIAAKSLQADLKKVTTDSALLIHHINQGENTIIIGTIGKNDLIDSLISRKKLNIDDIRGKWEAHITQVITDPFPGS